MCYSYDLCQFTLLPELYFFSCNNWDNKTNLSKLLCKVNETTQVYWLHILFQKWQFLNLFLLQYFPPPTYKFKTSRNCRILMWSWPEVISLYIIIWWVPGTTPLIQNWIKNDNLSFLPSWQDNYWGHIFHFQYIYIIQKKIKSFIEFKMYYI